MDLGKDFSPRTHTFLFVDLKKGLGGGGGGGVARFNDIRRRPSTIINMIIL